MSADLIDNACQDPKNIRLQEILRDPKNVFIENVPRDKLGTCYPTQLRLALLILTHKSSSMTARTIFVYSVDPPQKNDSTCACLTTRRNTFPMLHVTVHADQSMFVMFHLIHRLLPNVRSKLFIGITGRGTR